jgi:hypothetical protein
MEYKEMTIGAEVTNQFETQSEQYTVVKETS